MKFKTQLLLWAAVVLASYTSLGAQVTASRDYEFKVSQVITEDMDSWVVGTRTGITVVYEVQGDGAIVGYGPNFQEKWRSTTIASGHRINTLYALGNNVMVGSYQGNKYFLTLVDPQTGTVIKSINFACFARQGSRMIVPACATRFIQSPNQNFILVLSNPPVDETTWDIRVVNDQLDVIIQSKITEPSATKLASWVFFVGDNGTLLANKYKYDGTAEELQWMVPGAREWKKVTLNRRYAGDGANIKDLIATTNSAGDIAVAVLVKGKNKILYNEISFINPLTGEVTAKVEEEFGSNPKFTDQNDSRGFTAYRYANYIGKTFVVATERHGDDPNEGRYRKLEMHFGSYGNTGTRIGSVIVSRLYGISLAGSSVIFPDFVNGYPDNSRFLNNDASQLVVLLGQAKNSLCTKTTVMMVTIPLVAGNGTGAFKEIPISEEDQKLFYVMHNTGFTSATTFSTIGMSGMNFTNAKLVMMRLP